MLDAGGIGADETDPARVAAVVALLSAGARVNDANKDGYTALHLAALCVACLCCSYDSCILYRVVRGEWCQSS